MRADAALRAALRRTAGGGACRRPGGQRDRRQRGGPGRRHRHRPAIRAGHARRARRRDPTHRRAMARRRNSGGRCNATPCGPTCRGDDPPHATPRCTARSSPSAPRERVPRHAWHRRAAGRRRGRARRERGRVVGARRGDRVLPVRRKRRSRDRAHPTAGAQRRRVPRPHRGRGARRAIRVARARPLGSGARPSLQSRQAARRSVRDRDRPAVPARSGDVRRGCAESGRQCVGDAEGDRRRARGPYAEPSAGRSRRADHLRAARTRLHPAPSRHSGRAPRHLRRARAPGRDRASATPRRHRGRADAGRRLARRAAPGAARAHQLLGLQPGGVPRPRPATGAGRLGRDPRRRGRPARCGHRRAAGRGAQPHRRGRPSGADRLAARAGQRQLLPPAARRSFPVRQRHGMRSHARAGSAADAAPGDGGAARLGVAGAGSTGSASTSPPRSDAAPAASIPTRRCSRRSTRIRCCGTAC